MGVGAPHVHAWIALMQALCTVEKTEKKDVKAHEDLCKRFAHLMNCFVDRDLAAALGEYCQVTVHNGPAPKGPMERQAQETLDKFLKENKDE